MSAELARRELATRELARRDFKFFVKLKWERFNCAPFLDNWHQDYICEALSCTLPSYAQKNGYELIRRLMLNMPPSYGKTELIARCFIAWALGRERTRKFIYVSYSDELCRKINNQVRALIKSKFWASLFGKPNFLQDNSSEFEFLEGGGLFATTLKSAITGFHAHQILIDDPIKVSDMASKKERDNVCENFTTSILTRLQDSQSNITILMQRLGDNDLCGFLLNERNFSRELIDQWTHLKLSALNDTREIYKVGKFEFDRPANTPLFPAKHDLAGLEYQKQVMGIDDFTTQYLQDPQVSFAGFFDEELWREVGSFEVGVTNDYIFVDNAMSVNEKADNRAVVVIGVEASKTGLNRYIIKDCFYGIWDEDGTTEAICEAMSRYPQSQVFIESDGGGLTLHRLLQKKIIEFNEGCKRRGLPLLSNSTQTYTPSRKVSKVEKIKAIKPYYNTGALVFLRSANGLEQIKRELFSFNPEKPFRKDDCIDCIASCISAEFIFGGVQTESLTFATTPQEGWGL